jgi:hypothetical protein
MKELAFVIVAAATLNGAVAAQNPEDRLYSGICITILDDRHTILVNGRDDSFVELFAVTVVDEEGRRTNLDVPAETRRELTKLMDSVRRARFRLADSAPLLIAADGVGVEIRIVQGLRELRRSDQLSSSEHRQVLEQIRVILNRLRRT